MIVSLKLVRDGFSISSSSREGFRRFSMLWKNNILSHTDDNITTINILRSMIIVSIGF